LSDSAVLRVPFTWDVTAAETTVTDETGGSSAVSGARDRPVHIQTLVWVLYTVVQHIGAGLVREAILDSQEKPE